MFKNQNNQTNKTNKQTNKLKTLRFPTVLMTSRIVYF